MTNLSTEANQYPTPAQDAADAALAEEIEEELAEEERGFGKRDDNKRTQ